MMKTKKIRIFLGKILYNLLAKKMPLSDAKVSFGSKRIRAFCGKLMLAYCGNNVNIEKGASFGLDVSLGDNSGIGVNALLSEHITIGNDVMMGPDCMMFTSNHGMKKNSVPMWKQSFSEPRPIVIGNDVWIGARVIILPGVHIANGTVIGAGSVVTHDSTEYSIIAGVPAKIVGYRKER